MQTSVISTLGKEYRKLSEKCRKILVKNNLEIIMMYIVEDSGGMHGYGIMDNIRRLFGIYFGSSTIYPALSDLEEEGVMKSEWNLSGNLHPRKKFYLTPEGKLRLQASKKEFRELAKRIGSNPNVGTRRREYYEYLVREMHD